MPCVCSRRCCVWRSGSLLSCGCSRLARRRKTSRRERGFYVLRGPERSFFGARAGTGIPHQRTHAALHNAGGLDHLRQEHLALAKQHPNALHCRHHHIVNDLQRRSGGLKGLQAVLFYMVGNAVQHSVAYALLRRTCPPVLCGRNLSGSTFAHLCGIFREPLASVGATAQNHIFYTLQQLPGNIVINPEHLWIDYAHIHPGQPCVIKKCRMHSLAHRIVAAKGKGKVRNPARNLCVREILFDPAGSLYEIQCVAVVLFDSGGNCQNIWIENDIFCGESAFNQKIVGAPRNCNLTFETCGLPLFVKQHHHCRSAVRTYQSGPPQELFGAFFERDGVHNGLALAALQPRHYGVQRR